MEQQIKNLLIGKISTFFVIATASVLSSCTGHSGIVSADRLEMGKSQLMTQWDLNRDGKITCLDAVQMQNRKFVKADLNNDGILDIKEFKQAPWSNVAFAEEHLSLFDQDHDTIVSVQEFENKPNTEFTSMDRDQNCVLSDREIAIMLAEGRDKGVMRGGKKGNGTQRGKFRSAEKD